MAVNWSRKADDWDDVKADSRPSVAAMAVGKVIRRAEPTPNDTLIWGRPAEQWFLAERGDDVFLVNTEGYEYCRYAVRLPGFRLDPCVNCGRQLDEHGGCVVCNEE